jgi:hypothetical protein
MNEIYGIKVKATTMHYDYVNALNDYMTDIATDGDNTPRWQDQCRDMDVLRSAICGKAKTEELEQFFKDGNTMMALGASCMHEIEKYFSNKGSEDDLILIITDEEGKTLYTISGQYLNY